MGQGVCKFASPQLATAVSGGAAPTFAFESTNANYFQLKGSLTLSTSSGVICTYPTDGPITPLVIGSGTTRTCSVLSGSASYTQIDCPNIINNEFTAGGYTLAFVPPGASSIEAQNFFVALPTSSVVSATATNTVFIAATTTSFITPSNSAVSSSEVLSSSIPSSSSSAALSSSASGVASSTAVVSSSAAVSSSSDILSSSQVVSASASSSSSDVSSSAQSSTLSSSAGSSSNSAVSSSSSSAAVSSSSIAASASSSSSSEGASSSVVSASSSSSVASASSSASSDFSSIGSASSTVASSSSSSVGSVSSSAVSSSSASSAASASSSAQSSSSSQVSSSNAASSSAASSSTRFSSSALSTLSTRTSSSASATPTLKISPDATCGGRTGYTCQGSRFGNCCSQHGWCGSTSAYCGTGCQLAFGTCSISTLSVSTRSSSSSIRSSSSSIRSSSSSIRSSSSSIRSSSTSTRSSAAPSSTLKVSTNGRCGSGTTCQGSSYGNCCSQYGYCGSTSAYCAAGCNPLFGSCSGQSVPSPTPSTPTLKISTDGKCGGSTKQTCQGSTFGNCCSQYGWCGTSTNHCGTGCNSAFGTCTSPRLAVRDAGNSLNARQAVQGGGPDFTYPPIPTVTVFVATVFVTVATTTVTVVVTTDNVPITSGSTSSADLSSAFTPSETLVSSSLDISSSVSDLVSSSLDITSSAPGAISTLDSASITATPISASSSSAPSLPPVVVPSEFCLKVLTPGKSFGWFVKQTSIENNNGQLQLDPEPAQVEDLYLARFSLTSQGRVQITTPGLPSVKEMGYSRGTGGMVRWGDPGAPNIANCVVREDIEGYTGTQILRCSVTFTSGPRETLTLFRHYEFLEGLTNLFSSNDATTTTPTNYLIELGLFTGSDCPYPVAATSSEPVISSTSVDVSIPTPTPPTTTDNAGPSIEVTATPTSADISDSASSLIPSETPVPSAEPVLENFCLKVVTQGVRSTDWVIKVSNAAASNSAFWIDPVEGGVQPYVARFAIDDQGRLTFTTPGNAGNMLTGYSNGTGDMWRLTQNYDGFKPVMCSVKTDVTGFEGMRILKCTGTRNARTLTGFRHHIGVNNNGLDYIFGTDDFTTNTDTDFLIELGLFSGGACPAN